METLKFNHIGVATDSIQESIAAFSLIGYKQSSPIFNDSLQDVRVCFLESIGSPRLELIEPLSETSLIKDIIKKNRGTMPYHYAYEVLDLEQTLDDLQQEEFIRITRPTSSPAFDGRNVVFLYKENLGIV